MVSFRFLAFTLAACASTALAAPGDKIILDTYPEVIPGPGLPSLESLGLTSEDLYYEPTEADIAEAKEIVANAASFDLSPAAKRAIVPDTLDLEKRYDSGYMCGWHAAVRSQLIACRNYLAGLGSTPCAVTGGATGQVQMCSSGSAKIWANCGASFFWSNSNCPATVTCNFASGLATLIIDNCAYAEEGQLVAGGFGQSNVIPNFVVVAGM